MQSSETLPAMMIGSTKPYIWNGFFFWQQSRTEYSFIIWNKDHKQSFDLKVGLSNDTYLGDGVGHWCLRLPEPEMAPIFFFFYKIKVSCLFNYISGNLTTIIFTRSKFLWYRDILSMAWAKSQLGFSLWLLGKTNWLSYSSPFLSCGECFKPVLGGIIHSYLFLCRIRYLEPKSVTSLVLSRS